MIEGEQLVIKGAKEFEIRKEEAQLMGLDLKIIRVKGRIGGKPYLHICKVIKGNTP